MSPSFVPVAPTDVAPLLAPLHAELLSLLGTLAAQDWDRPTRAGSWCVRDVAAHLLDGDLRKLSFHRDGQLPPAPEAPIAGYRDLVAYINRLNADGVRTAERLSPRLLVDLLAFTGPQVSAFVESLPPEGRAIFGVAWAGQETSPNWLDTGREYTERWHHQQQIREAVGRLFFKAISPAEAAERIALEGEDRLGRKALGALAVMA